LKSIDSSIPQRPFFRVTDCADLLGVAPATVYGWIRSKNLNAHKIGGVVLIYRQDLVEALHGNR
jgi:excisionase family DNA binding protein